MRENYSAWNIDVKDFPETGLLTEQLTFLIGYAILAPSSHNSQPWRFAIENSSVAVSFEGDRLLPVCDPDNRLAGIAIGCAIENFCVAADYFNFHTSVSYLHADDRVATVHCYRENSGHKGDDHLIFSIPKRESNRSAYTPAPVPTPLLETVAKDCGNAIQCAFVTNDADRKAITDLVMKYRILAFNNPAFRSEMASYKRTNLTKKPDGMPGFTMGFPTVFSLFAPMAIRLFNVVKLTEKKETELLLNTPVHAFLLTDDMNKEKSLRLGRALEHMLLILEQNGVAASLNVVSPSPQARETLRSILHTEWTPHIFIRMGYAAARLGHSPRYPVSNVLTSVYV